MAPAAAVVVVVVVGVVVVVLVAPVEPTGVDELGGLAGGVGIVGLVGLPGGGGVGRTLGRVTGVGGLSDGQVFRCLSANHAGAPLAMASSGQVIRYIETSRTVRQRPSRKDTQYGSPECSLAMTAHPPPQSMMRDPLRG